MFTLKVSTLLFLNLSAACSEPGRRAYPAESVVGPFVAGPFYPAGAAELNAVLEDFLNQAPEREVEGLVLGAMAPHAGYVYSGQTAANVYKLLKGRSYKTVILMGTGHYAPVQGAATMAAGNFRTPLGNVPVDAAMARRLLQFSSLIVDSPAAYEREHSVEVQIPFLQKVLGRFSLLPLLLNTQDPKICEQVGRAVAHVARSSGTLLLVSTDLSHYPDSETARRVDRASLKALAFSLEDPFYVWMASRLLLERGGPKLGTTYCGEAALLAALFVFKEWGANRVRQISYTNSGLLPHGDKERAVGYASVLWTRSSEPVREGASLTRAQRKTLLRMARSSIEEYLKKKKGPEAVLWEDPEFNIPANVFVTLKKRGAPLGEDLRGCVGSVQLQFPLGEAVQRHAIASATEDRRFQPVTLKELRNLRIEISRLSFYKSASSHHAIEPGRHGVLLLQGNKSGIFLPMVWEQIRDRETFLSELCVQKAGLNPHCWKDTRTRLLTFTVEDFSEE